MKARFEKIHIEISNVCNLQCSFCPEVLRPKKIMDLDLFARIVRQVAPLTEQVALHLMGDPLLHPKLEEMIELCHSQGLRIFFVTNGVLLNEKRARLLLHPALRQVNFSLHSFHDNFGDRDPTQYLEGIFSFTETAFRLRPDLYINFRLWNLQDPQGSTKLNRAMLERIAERFQVAPPQSLDVRQKKSFRLVHRLYLHFDTEFTWPNLELPRLGERGTCYGLRSHFGILADGTVVPCCLDKEGLIPLGNAQTEEIAAILEAPRAQKILQGFKQRKLAEELCQRCPYIERFQKKSARHKSTSVLPAKTENSAP